MKAPVHIVGGLVFTGTMCSFTDVNIFGDWKYLAVCVVCSVLPDIDSTRSFMGRLFYPLAWFLNRKVGHRTFTHSLLFLFLIWGGFSLMMITKVVHDDKVLKTALFALLSHFVFDMMTVAGIPLFYPFYRNPCVIPGNPSYRFKNDDIKSEFVVFGICALLCVTLQPLFANGFWMSYDRTFATVRHVDRENGKSEFYIICEYDYVRNGERKTGEAIVLESARSKLTLFDGLNVFVLSDDDGQLKINHAKPKLSSVVKKTDDMQFFNITFDSIQNILAGKLTSGTIQSNLNFEYTWESITYRTDLVQYKNRFNFRLSVERDSTKMTGFNTIQRLEARINQGKREFNQKHNVWLKRLNRIKEIENSLSNSELSNYDRNKQQIELIKLKAQNPEEPVYIPPVEDMEELANLKLSVNKNSLLFSGRLTVYNFGCDEELSPVYEPKKSGLFMDINNNNNDN